MLQPRGIEKWLKPSPYPHVVYFLRGSQAVNKWCQYKYYKDFKKELRIKCGDAVPDRVVVRAFKRTRWSYMNLNELREMWRLEQEGFCPLLGPVCYCSAKGYVQVHRSRRRLSFTVTYKVQRKVEDRREYGSCMKGAQWLPCPEQAGAGGGVRVTGRHLETSQPAGAGVQVTGGDSSHYRGRRVRSAWLWATFWRQRKMCGLRITHYIWMWDSLSQENFCETVRSQGFLAQSRRKLFRLALVIY